MPSVVSMFPTRRCAGGSGSLDLALLWGNGVRSCFATSLITRTQTFTYDDLQRLLTAAGVYGSTSYAYDAVGNRTQKISTPVGGTATTETYTYATTSNRLNTVGDGTITRTFSPTF